MELQETSIVLMGIKHCGKSTLGKALASRLECPFFDTDDLITELTQKTPRQIFTEQGAEGFEKAECNACKALAKKSEEIEKAGQGSKAVIATGGGICNNHNALAQLRKLKTLFVFLEVSEEVAAARIVAEAAFKDGKISNLPAYIAKKNPHTIDDVRNIFHDFYVERTARYKEIADICVPLENKSIEENTANIVKLVTNFLKSN